MNSIKEAVTSDFRNTPMCKKGNLIKLPLLAAACTEEFMLSLSTIPRQISSASASVSARSQNVGGGGSTMPESLICNNFLITNYEFLYFAKTNHIRWHCEKVNMLF